MRPASTRCRVLWLGCRLGGGSANRPREDARWGDPDEHDLRGQASVGRAGGHRLAHRPGALLEGPDGEGAPADATPGSDRQTELLASPPLRRLQPLPVRGCRAIPSPLADVRGVPRRNADDPPKTSCHPRQPDQGPRLAHGQLTADSSRPDSDRHTGPRCSTPSARRPSRTDRGAGPCRIPRRRASAGQPGSSRRTVGTRSMARSKETITPTPVRSALATRYASAKSSRWTSYTSTARCNRSASRTRMAGNASTARSVEATCARAAPHVARGAGSRARTHRDRDGRVVATRRRPAIARRSRSGSGAQGRTRPGSG